MEKFTRNTLWAFFSIIAIFLLIFRFNFWNGEKKEYVDYLITISTLIVIGILARLTHLVIEKQAEKNDEQTKNILNSIFLAKEIFPDGWPSDMVELINGNDREKKNDLLLFGMKGLNLPAYALEEKIIHNVGHLSDWKITFLRAKLQQRFGIDCKKHFDHKFKDIKEFAEKVFDTFLLFDRKQNKKTLANVVANKMVQLVDSGSTGEFPLDLDKMLEYTKYEVMIVSCSKGDAKNLIQFFEALEVAYSDEKVLIAKTQ